MPLPDAKADLSRILVTLLKSVIYRESDPSLWQSLHGLQTRVREHVLVLDLELMLDEAEGYAYLRQRPASDGDAQIPRLVPRRQLGYLVSLMLALLRKKLAEFDATSGDTRLILSREDVVQLVRVFLSDSTNEAGVADRIDVQINKVVDMGFLRPLRGRENHFEVCRIIKSFVDAQWLSEFESRLAAYHQHGALLSGEQDGGRESA